MTTNLSLLDLDQDAFCNVIEQLQPIQIQNLPALLTLSKEFANRIIDCITEIDFTNGVPLLTENGLINHAALSGTIWAPVIAKYDRLREYRVSFDVEAEFDELTYRESRNFENSDSDSELGEQFERSAAQSDLERLRVQEWQRLVLDARARWISLQNFYQNEVEQSLILEGLRERIKRYGANFTFSNYGGIGFSYHDGTMILLTDETLSQDEWLGAMKIWNELMSGFGELIHTVGCTDLRVIIAFLDQVEIYPNISKIIMFDDGRVVTNTGVMDFADNFSIARLRPYLNRLTEIDFQVNEGKTYSEIPTRPGDRDDYYNPLILELRRDPELTFPNVTKYDIPIPIVTVDRFKQLFPNVKRFYFAEEHNLAKQTSELVRRMKNHGITDLRRK